MNLFEKLVCPNCKTVALHCCTTATYDDEPVPVNGYALCDRCHSHYPISDHILDLASCGPHLLTLAGRTNNAPLAPLLYEHVWRTRSLSLMTGESFPPAREMALIAEWADPTRNDLVLDIGTSTGFYARGLARASGDRAQIVALDHAPGMLAMARRNARREGLKNIAYLRAFAQALPYADASVDVIVCGGSLNEFRSLEEALREMRRVLKPNGRIVTMSLSKAESAKGLLAQRFFSLSGIRFPTRAAFGLSVLDAGLKAVRQEAYGIVTFCRLERVESRSDLSQTASKKGQP